MFKKMFGGGGSKKEENDREYTIDELIILERFDEAILKLKAKQKVKDELHDHLKLADCYGQVKELEKAVDEYVYVADEFARDGFFDKATAILTRAAKIAPLDETIPQRIERVDQLRRLEQSRAMAVEGLARKRASDGEGSAPSTVEFQTLWASLSKTQIVRRLSGEQLRLLFAAVKVLYVDPDQSLVTRGQITEALFIIAKGVLEAEAADGTMLRAFGPGDVLNESGLFERRPAPADITVRERGAVLQLDRSGLEACLTGNPDPRHFLSMLRDQAVDRDLANMLAKLGKL